MRFLSCLQIWINYEDIQNEKLFINFSGLVLPQIKTNKTKYQMFDYFLEVPSLENDRNIREKSMSKSVSQFFGAQKKWIKKKNSQQ